MGELTKIIGPIGLAVGITAAGFGGLVYYLVESGKVRGENVVYTSSYHGEHIEVVQQDVKWRTDTCFIRGSSLRLERGELVTDRGELITLGDYPRPIWEGCYDVQDFQPNDTSEE